MSAFASAAFSAQPASLPEGRARLFQAFRQTRSHTMRLAAPLSAEDQCIQSMPDASPTKWHLAHTAWFFEAVVLMAHEARYQPFDRRLHHLFNSYYESLGARHPRPQRGLLSRPDLPTVHAFRQHVDEAIARLIADADDANWERVAPLIELGIHHEQQHQELVLTDILHALSCNPLLPPYRAAAPSPRLAPARAPLAWLRFDGGACHVGHEGSGFSFDNEGPRHTVLLRPYELANRLVTCGEWLAFMADSGYREPAWWLSDGWALVQAQGWQAPGYWIEPGDPRAPSTEWQVFGLEGLRPVDPSAPVLHLSFYEAAAFAEWSGARLPTEFEWEAAWGTPGLEQMTGTAWQWTRSSYDPYPGFRPAPGVVSEYNGKFMVSQLVLRGGSAATPAGHTRPSYRNFFPPAARWQFSGLRLARDLAC